MCIKAARTEGTVKKTRVNAVIYLVIDTVT